MLFWFFTSNALGSDEEQVILPGNQVKIPFEEISSENFSVFLRTLGLSRLVKIPNNMRGHGWPRMYPEAKREYKDKRKAVVLW